MENTEIDVDFPEIELPPHSWRACCAVPPSGVALFRGKRFLAIESEPGATAIVLVGVGQRMQMPISVRHNEDVDGIPAAVFAAAAEFSDANGVLWDTWQANTPVPMYAVVRNRTDKPVRWSAKVAGDWVKEL